MNISVFMLLFFIGVFIIGFVVHKWLLQFRGYRDNGHSQLIVRNIGVISSACKTYWHHRRQALIGVLLITMTLGCSKTVEPDPIGDISCVPHVKLSYTEGCTEYVYIVGQFVVDRMRDGTFWDYNFPMNPFASNDCWCGSTDFRFTGGFFEFRLGYNGGWIDYAENWIIQ